MLASKYLELWSLQPILWGPARWKMSNLRRVRAGNRSYEGFAGRHRHPMRTFSLPVSALRPRASRMYFNLENWHKGAGIVLQTYTSQPPPRWSGRLFLQDWYSGMKISLSVVSSLSQVFVTIKKSKFEKKANRGRDCISPIWMKHLVGTATIRWSTVTFSQFFHWFRFSFVNFLVWEDVASLEWCGFGPREKFPNIGKQWTRAMSSTFITFGLRRSCHHGQQQKQYFSWLTVSSRRVKRSGAEGYTISSFQ